MRGLDTNILVRYLTQDDPDQFASASDLIEQAEHDGDRLYLNAVVLCELVWVLRGRRYRHSRSEIAEMLDKLTEIPVFELQSRAQVLAALAEYRSGEADFADCLIGQQNLAAGCADTVTFDSVLADSPSFAVL